MKRVVIIEGNVSSLSRHDNHGEVDYAVIITDGERDASFDTKPEAADQIGASFREPVRVVVEIGEADLAVGTLASATREELIHALAAARHAADEYQRENESLSRRMESLECGTALFDPEKHITKATVAKWLEEDARSSDRAASCQRALENTDAANMMTSCAEDTRAIIARINDHKDSP